MIRTPACTLHTPPRPASRRSEWTVLRGILLLVNLFAASAFALPDGRPRRAALRFLKALLPKLEQALRCLLVLMRRAPASQSSASVFARLAARAHARRGPPRRARFSLTLQHFSWMPKAAHAATATARPVRSPDHSPLDLPVPGGALQQRLDALKAAFENPEPHAARISAALHARGYCARRLAVLIPSAELFRLYNLKSLLAAFARPDTRRLDSS